MKTYLPPVLLVLLGAAGLVYPVWINGYPLVYSDTGTYIRSGFLNLVPADRPIVYGLLLRHLCLAETLVLFIIAQAVVVSAAVYVACAQLINARVVTQRLVYVGCMVGLITTTGLPWFTSWLMPDVFSGVALLLLLVLLCSKTPLSSLVPAIVCYSVVSLTHLSNMLSHLLFLVLAVVLWLVVKRFRMPSRVSVKRVAWLFGIVVCNYVWMLVINFAVERKWFISHGSTIFLTAKLCDYGLVNTYLETYDATETPELYALRDSIQPSLGHFLWGANSVLVTMGGWEHPPAEFAILNRNILSTPPLLAAYIRHGLSDTYDQWVSINVGQDFLNYGDSSSSPFGAVNWFVKKDARAFITAKQQTGTLDFPFGALNLIQQYVIWLLYVLGVVCLLLRVDFRTKWMIGCGMLLLLSNAVCCAFLTSVGGRYQGRVVWIVVVIMVITCVNNRAYLKQLFHRQQTA